MHRNRRGVTDAAAKFAQAKNRNETLRNFSLPRNTQRRTQFQMSVPRFSIPENFRRATGSEGGPPADIPDLIRRLGLWPGREAFFGHCPTCGKISFSVRPIPAGVEVGCAACGDPGLIRLSMLRAFPEVKLANFEGQTP